MAGDSTVYLMSHRFFVESPIEGDSCHLSEDEAHHLTRVMRAGVGDEITLFDGSGWEFFGRIVEVGKRSAQLAIVSRRQVNRELPFPLTIAVALPKGDRQKFLVEKLVELGVARLIPLETARGVAQAGEASQERLTRAVIEASKQCGRNQLMKVSHPLDMAGLIAGTTSSALRLVCDPRGEPLRDFQAASGDLLAAIGPEGGFSDQELSTFDKAGWDRVSMGPRILRIETAALALAAWASLR
jgi:16S rRNA (uracil1498-N3)-methyltransferase